MLQIDFAPALLGNLEDIVKIVSMGLKENILTSTFEYTGNAISECLW